MKRKKERRKHRKVAPGSKKVDDQPINDNDDQSEESQEEKEIEQVEKPSEPKKPPRKRQKVDSDDDSTSSSSASEESEESEEDEVHDKPPQPPQRDAPTPPPPTLHIFPLPVAPDAPSKATLALQGLDQALLTAELIEPTISVPLDEIDKHAGRSPEKNGQAVLSARMKKRLHELGIVELFAGG